MEKKEKSPRRKPEVASQLTHEPATGESGPDHRAISAESISMGKLSEMADSARKNILHSGESSQEESVSAQAELLKSRNKVEEVRKRIQSGYYGQPDIIGRIIDKLADDLRP